MGKRVGEDVLGGLDGAAETDGTLVGLFDTVGYSVGPSEGKDDGIEEKEGKKLGDDAGDSVGNGTGVGAFDGTGTVGRFEIVGAFVIGIKERGANVEAGREGGRLACAGAEVVGDDDLPSRICETESVMISALMTDDDDVVIRLPMRALQKTQPVIKGRKSVSVGSVCVLDEPWLELLADRLLLLRQRNFAFKLFWRRVCLVT